MNEALNSHYLASCKDYFHLKAHLINTLTSEHTTKNSILAQYNKINHFPIITISRPSRSLIILPPQLDTI